MPEVGEIVGLDPAAVTRWFGSLGVEFTAPLSFDRIGLGQSNLTFLVRDAEERRWVLRRPPLGHLLASAHDVAREARIMAALAETEVPVPRIFGVAQDPSVSEVPLVLMEFLDGQVVDTMPIVESIAPQRRRAIGVSLPRALAKIHAVDLEATGLTDLASHKPYGQRQLKRWSGQWEVSKTRELPELDDLTRRLAGAVPEQREVALVHGDFHLRNVIVSRETGDVIGALDWELSTLGDPLADMGSMLAYWPEPGEHAIGDFPASTLAGFPTRAELAEIYLDETGRDAAALKFWHVLGLWKIAVIAEGVRRRAMENPQNRAAAGTPTVEQIDALVRRAREVAADAGI
ncbi:Predicted kinase, aminoglycoside phosphotransferase (APT) family [Rhodococcus maanshanensis]|uniref:Predicted kinase, aminoglycoside phosphotransferase (APT) family n=1 Tax=Rhodococcus maanshanensis TaxID=183556 RepID=A0A1H7WJF5_9NOCA|nr:phosphotransferase family protein [Rhodococcus maanshanensis]SEM21643.1 Predicted kinase, aminoglycoside phosphotransferase (APT) family [Rhodococcus maanshanensis]